MPVDSSGKISIATDNTNSCPRCPAETLPKEIWSIQPGGGSCMQIELAWGYFRRWYLRRFRPAYVSSMRILRRGEENRCPHEVLDPRDVKFFRNLGGFYWNTSDDPFRWRDRLPFVREGLAELILLGGGLIILAIALSAIRWWLAVVPLVLACEVFWFFRDPKRRAPLGDGLILAPADGKLVELTEVDHDPFIQGPAITIGIFLSVFNVHVNRMPISARVIGLSYRPGKFLNALRAASSHENESLELRIEATEPPFRRLRVRQIAGAIARRIVCGVGPDEQLKQGEKFGMIKFGSRTELVLPREEGLKLVSQVGQNVKAGTTILARYEGFNEAAGPMSGIN